MQSMDSSNKYPQRNSFEMAAHDSQFEKQKEKAPLVALKEALADFNAPMFREDGKLNI